MHDYMQRYKFNGEYALRHVFNRQLIQAVQNIEIDLVVPIPVSQYTLLTRSFNQTLGLFEGLRYQQLLSVSQAKKTDQSRFNRQKRLTRAQPFVIANDISLSGQSVLLIDDVYTTGRTLYYAAELIYTLGAKNVKSLSLAR
ncbi:ComF family protein [Leuconostoc citreum]|uniref:ComF family protein n=1 Tax=Leuconostoc citreum TaxID=33964 RepID=UPI0002466444|nr:phosphoribosyltransferase family protein [Leuconostoc citreum]CCF23757.1 ComF operon protein 3 [Leuconostoc citreum LBAE C10]